eukprot:5013628-Heterocapsa_arctica.AAC.1
MGRSMPLESLMGAPARDEVGRWSPGGGAGGAAGSPGSLGAAAVRGPLRLRPVVPVGRTGRRRW